MDRKLHSKIKCVTDTMLQEAYLTEADRLSLCAHI